MPSIVVRSRSRPRHNLDDDHNIHLPRRPLVLLAREPCRVCAGSTRAGSDRDLGGTRLQAAYRSGHMRMRSSAWAESAGQRAAARFLRSAASAEARLPPGSSRVTAVIIGVRERQGRGAVGDDARQSC